jgi:hypothetical protein
MISLSVSEILSPPAVSAPASLLLTDPISYIPTRRTRTSTVASTWASNSIHSYMSTLPTTTQAFHSDEDVARPSVGIPLSQTSTISADLKTNNIIPSPSDQAATATEPNGLGSAETGESGTTTAGGIEIGIGSTLVGVFMLALLGSYFYVRRRIANSSRNHSARPKKQPARRALELGEDFGVDLA